MKTKGHDTVCGIEGFLDAITVMTIYIYVQNSGVCAQEFEDGKDNVVYVAKASCFALFGVVEATCPVDSNIS